jgi:hypothetical protein
MASRPPKPIDRPGAARFKSRSRQERTGTEAALTALRTLINAQASTEHVPAFIDEIKAEKNDRGAAILAATNIENALGFALERRLHVHSGQYERLFGWESSPLGTFENKIRIAYALDVFGEETKQNLYLIKAIRNAFAHAKIPIKFETDEVSDVCNFFELSALLPPCEVSQEPPPFTRPRDKFFLSCDHIAQNLVNYAIRCSQTDSSGPENDPRYELHVIPKPLP